MRKLYAFLFFVLLLGVAGSVVLWFQSPYIFANSLVTAVNTNDYAKLRRVIDIRAFRGDALVEMALTVPASLRRLDRSAKKGRTDDLSKYPGEIFSAYAISPEGISSLLTGRGVLPPDVLSHIPPEMIVRRTMVTDYRYGDTYDLFVIKFVCKETGEEAQVLLTRNGWFLWKAMRVEVNQSLYLPFRVPRT